jgi:hypothetical protein
VFADHARTAASMSFGSRRTSSPASPRTSPTTSLSVRSAAWKLQGALWSPSTAVSPGRGYIARILIRDHYQR